MDVNAGFLVSYEDAKYRDQSRKGCHEYEKIVHDGSFSDPQSLEYNPHRRQTRM